ncbi:hypothetical protein B0T14DRAFT_275587 [Immersiella caudata]|uniref:Uncharacterized protein n=1 Tax=Immersiella caudata TaxID=314043 RepID=A0AA40BTN0_9PEZI|nr:hypothetical protein B0T14DRAFT_275587 [Immersiella caudata]
MEKHVSAQAATPVRIHWLEIPSLNSKGNSSTTPTMTDPSPNPDSEVSWQTAWWALIPLATTCMLQPCGNILGLKKTSGATRFYARASPVVCLADTAYTLSTLVLCINLNRHKFVANLKYELGLRFSRHNGNGAVGPQEQPDCECGAGGQREGDIEGEDDIDGDFITSPEKSRLWRFLFLGLSGTGCQTVKLVAMKGVPWTQAWALMFSVSIVVGEVLTFMNGMSSLTVSDGEVLVRPGWRSSRWYLWSTEMTGELHQVVPFLFNFPLVAWGFVALMHRGSPLESADAGFTYLILAYSATMMVMTIGALWDMRTRLRAEEVLLILVSQLALLRAVLWGLLILPLQISMHGDRIELQDVLYSFLFIFAGSLPSILLILATRALRVRVLQRFLRIRSRIERNAFLIFLTSFLVSVVYYAVAFDPTATYKPDWTDVFG